MSDASEVLDHLRAPTRSLRKAAPEAWAGFAALQAGALSGTAISPQLKEVIALALAVVKHCDGCIASHAGAAARAGASPAEVSEALSLTLLMDGGPATVYAPRAWQAFLDSQSALNESVEPKN